jgi:SAM-dependent methyltransferase
MTLHKPQHHTTSRDVTQTLQAYEKDAGLFLKQWGRKRYKRPALLVQWLKLLPERAVLLDLGCGAGQDSHHLATRGHHVIGLDRTMPLLQFANGQFSSVPLILADIRALPIRTDSLDGVWAAASLIHLPKRAVQTARLFCRDHYLWEQQPYQADRLDARPLFRTMEKRRTGKGAAPCWVDGAVVTRGEQSRTQGEVDQCNCRVLR